MIAVAIAAVPPGMEMAAIKNALAAIFTVGVMNGDPHAGARSGVRAAEIRIIRVPARTAAAACRFQKNMIKFLGGTWAEQALHRGDHRWMPGQCAQQTVMRTPQGHS